MREPAVETAHHADSDVAGEVDGSDIRSGLKELFFIFRQMHFPLKTDESRGIDGDCGVVQYAVVIFGECSGDGTADFFLRHSAENQRCGFGSGVRQTP